MKDFKKINVECKFFKGIRVDVVSDHSHEYLIQFWEKVGAEFYYFHTFALLPHHYYHFGAIQFSRDFQVRVLGWNREEQVTELLAVETYSHHGNNILLEFVSDTYEDHLTWLILSRQMKKDYKCNITVISRFWKRLPDIGIPLVEKMISQHDLYSNFYSCFTIGIQGWQGQFIDRGDIHRWPIVCNDWTAGAALSYYSSSHPQFPHLQSSEDLFKSTLNI
jgi:hypothetical protein